MGKDPAILFYTQDFFTRTATMSFEDRGKYITILCVMHKEGRMTEETIRFLVGSVSVNLKNKFKVDDDGLWYNERLEEEIEKRRNFTESRRNNGMQGGRPKKEEKPIGLATDNLPVNVNVNVIDYENIVENYHFLCPKMSKVIALNETRRGFINARYGEYGLEKIIQVLRLAGESDFLNGVNDKAWKADFEWIMRPQNFLKVLEGKYNNKVQNKKLAI